MIGDWEVVSKNSVFQASSSNSFGVAKPCYEGTIKALFRLY
jgi:hypothetical protein